METTCTSGQLKQLMTILKRNGVKPDGFQEALASGAVDDFFEAVGHRRPEVANADNEKRCRRRQGLGLTTRPNRGWYEVSYLHTHAPKKIGFAMIRKPAQLKKAVVYLFGPEDFGLPPSASPREVINAALARGYEYCPGDLTAELVRHKPRSRSRRGYIEAPIDAEKSCVILIWDTGQLQIQPGATSLDPKKDIPWQIMMAVTVE